MQGADEPRRAGWLARCFPSAFFPSGEYRDLQDVDVQFGKAYAAQGLRSGETRHSCSHSPLSVSPVRLLTAHKRPTDLPRIHVLNKCWVQWEKESQPSSDDSMLIEKVTPMDSIREVFNTMVAVATVIGPGHAIKFAPFREAVKQLLAIYPLLSGRMLPVSSPAARRFLQRKQRNAGSRLGSSGAMNQAAGITSESGAEWKPGYIIVAEPGIGSGVPLIEADLEGMDMEAAQAAIYGRTGHTMMSSNPDSLPVHLQALDASAMHHGQEPLAKVQISHLSDGSSIIGITAAHCIADGFTSAFILCELSRLYATQINPSNTYQPPLGVFYGRGMMQPASITLTASVAGPEKHCAGSGAEGAQAVQFAAPLTFEDQRQRFAYLTIAVKPSDNSCWKAFRSVRSASCAIHQAVRYLGPGAMMGQVTTLALHIPQCDLNAMKTKCSGWLMAYGHGWAWEKASSESGAKSQGMRSPQPLRLSSHDVIAAMLWLLVTHIRGRPLPGQPLDTSSRACGGAWGMYKPLLEDLKSRAFGITCDMRQNCSSLGLGGIGSNSQSLYLGNASCALQIRGCESHDVTGTAMPEPTSSASAQQALSHLVEREEASVPNSTPCGAAPVATGKASGDARPSATPGATAQDASVHKTKDHRIRGATATVEQLGEQLGEQGGKVQAMGKPAPTAQRGVPLPPTGSVDPTSIFPCAWAPGSAAKLTTQWLEAYAQDSAGAQTSPSGPVLALLASAASRVRKCVDKFRSLPDSGALVIDCFTNHNLASSYQRTASVANYIAKFDGFLTSWCQFPLGSASFGAPPTSVAAIQPIIQPFGPWSTIAVSTPPGRASGHGCAASDTQDQPQQHTHQQGGGGVVLYMTVPTIGLHKVKSSALLNAMAPNAQWL